MRFTLCFPCIVFLGNSLVLWLFPIHIPNIGQLGARWLNIVIEVYVRGRIECVARVGLDDGQLDVIDRMLLLFVYNRPT